MKYFNIAMLAVLLPVAGAYAGNGPCKEAKAEIVKACQAAGFVKGGHKDKKGLYKDCVGPIKAGQTVAGVTVDPAVLQACKDKKASKGSTPVPVNTTVKSSS